MPAIAALNPQQVPGVGGPVFQLTNALSLKNGVGAARVTLIALLLGILDDLQVTLVKPALITSRLSDSNF